MEGQARRPGGSEGRGISDDLNLWSVKVSPCNLETPSLPISILWNDLRPRLQMMPAVRFHCPLICVVTWPTLRGDS